MGASYAGLSLPLNRFTLALKLNRCYRDARRLLSHLLAYLIVVLCQRLYMSTRILTCHPAAACTQPIRAGRGLLAAAPLASAPSCRRLLDALARDTCLLVRLAELLAPPDEEDGEEDEVQEEVEEPRSMHEVLMEQVCGGSGAGLMQTHSITAK